MIFLMCSRKSAFSSLARMDGFVVMPAGNPRSSASSISTRFAESTKIFMVSPSGPAPSFRHGPVVVTGVAGLAEQTAPALRIRIGARGELPALELLALRLVEPRVHLDVTVAPAHPLDLAERADAVRALEVVQGVDGHD